MNENSRNIHAPWVFPPLKSPDLALLEKNEKGDFKTVVVRLKDVREIIRVYNLSQIFRGNFQNSILGCYVNVKFHKKDYIKEGLLKTIGYAFIELELHRVEASVQPANQDSINLFSAFGFRYEGISKNYL